MKIVVVYDNSEEHDDAEHLAEVLHHVTPGLMDAEVERGSVVLKLRRHIQPRIDVMLARCSSYGDY